MGRGAILLGLAAAVAASCGGGSPPKGTTPAAATVGPAGSASHAPGPEAAPASSASVAGEVGCGQASCDARRQVCCASRGGGASACVDRPAGGGELDVCPESSALIVACDDAGDCGAGERCCRSFDCTGEGCPHRTTCEPGLCSWGLEVCVAAGACGAGFRCVPGEGGELGRCEAESLPGVACGGKRCPRGAVCCWNAATATGACAADCPEKDDLARYTCTSPRDCGGYPCHDMVPGPPRPSFFCGSAADSERAGTLLCETLADCPARRVWGPELHEPKGCAPLDGAMPGVRACVYPDEG